MASTTQSINAVVELIAKEYLDIPTLECRGRDCLDFHDVGVMGLKKALHAAYEEGRKAQLQEGTTAAIVSR